jgi:hypothetical protein
MANGFLEYLSGSPMAPTNLFAVHWCGDASDYSPKA